MEINDDNMDWALEKLSRFRNWDGFPTEDEALTARARSFLRLVHNKPAKDICHYDPGVLAVFSANGVPLPEIDWDAKGISPDQNDADWILDLINETMDRFPLPVQMRELYSATLLPATTFGQADVRRVDRGEKS